ncbi:MAG: hypothetical protein NVS1B13_07280 [Flavisolibacter sp.]
MRNFFLVLLIGCTSLGAAGQKSWAKKGFHKENFFVGGRGGFSFGSYTILDLSPELGYRINRFLETGLGINGQFIYLKERDNGQLYRKIQQGGIGMNIFTRIYPVGPVMLLIQPEANYIFGKQIFYQPSRQAFRLDAILVPSLLVGGGVAFPYKRSYFTFALLYDVWHNANATYGRQPILHLGYFFHILEKKITNR